MHKLKTLFFIAVAAGCLFGAETPEGPDPDITLRDLLNGNQRFVADHATHPHQVAVRRTELSKAQHPGAIILGCADSRVPPELLFDQGLGDLFVIRVAGNVVDADVLGSIEYAVEHLGTRLIIVLGHQRCGAVSAAVAGGKPEAEGHIRYLLEAINPAVDETKGRFGDAVDNAMRANVHHMVSLIGDDEPIKPGIQTGKVKVVGARYDLDSGRVDILK